MTRVADDPAPALAPLPCVWGNTRTLPARVLLPPLGRSKDANLGRLTNFGHSGTRRVGASAGERVARKVLDG